MSSLKTNQETEFDAAYNERSQIYAAQAKSFHADKYQRAEASARQWRMVAMLALMFCVASIGLLYYLFPLKQFVPVYYTKDPVTKQMTAQPATDKTIMPDMASRDRKYWVNRFVVAREGWNPVLKKERASLVRIMSNERVWDHYFAEHGGFSLKSHEAKYGDDMMRLVRLHSISHLSKTTSTFRMEVKVIKGQEIIKENWQGVIKYRWRPKKVIKKQEQLVNPYGFKVVRYEVNKELINNPGQP